MMKVSRASRHRLTVSPLSKRADLVTLGCFLSEPLSERDASAQRFAEGYACRNQSHRFNELVFRGTLAKYLRCRDTVIAYERHDPINVNRCIAIASGIPLDELKLAS